MTGEGRGFWISTIRLPWNEKLFETLVFPEPRANIEDYYGIMTPDINPYILTNIPDVRMAKRNHREAVQAAIRSLQTV